MRKYILVSCLVCAWLQIGFADTTWVPAGDVSGVWAREGSPYIIQGDIRVAPGDTLLVTEGVTVAFNLYTRLLIDSGAAFFAHGTIADSINFVHSEGGLWSPWYGIGATSAIMEFDFCRIRDVRGQPPAGLYAMNSIVRISHSLMTHSVADYQDANGRDGIVAMENCSLVVSNFEVAENWPISSSFKIDNCVALVESVFVHHNHGEGLYVTRGSETTVRNTTVSNNEGTGVLFYGGILEACMISDNHDNESFGAGGGLVVGDDAVITNCTIVRNSCEADGGGIYFASGYPQMDHCIIDSNHAARGGGIYFGFYPRLRLSRSTIVRNSASVSGSAIEFSTSTDQIQLTTCIIAHNTGAAAVNNPPRAIWNQQGVFYSCFFENAAGNFSDNAHPGILENLAALNSNGDSCDGLYNIYLNPEFVDYPAGDYHLTEASPCIDAGQHSLPRDPDTTYADIGAFYFDQIVTVDEKPDEVASEIGLLQLYPNPFNAATRLSFALEREMNVRAVVYDLTGRLVTTLFNGVGERGENEFIWNASDQTSGLYFIRLESETFYATTKAILLK